MTVQRQMLCKGPRVFVADKKAELEAKVKTLSDQLDQVHESAKAGVQGKLNAIDDEYLRLNSLDDNDFLEFAGCGEDLWSIIESLPQDGELYEYDCPRCGTMHRALRTPEESAQ